MDVEETLVEGDQDGNMKDRIRIQLIHMNPINEQKPTKKFVDWNGQTVEEEVSKDYLKTLGRIGDIFISWDLHRPIAC
jgi:hypothetical protein